MKFWHNLGKATLGAGVLLLAMLSLALVPLKARATDVSWLNSPTLALSRTTNSNIDQPAPFSINGNRDCMSRKVILKPARPLIQNETSMNDCAVETMYGAVSTSGYLQRLGSEVWGNVLQPSGAPTTLIPIPRSNQALQFSSVPTGGLYFSVVNNVDQALHSSTDSLGQVTHTLTPTSVVPLKDKSGQLLPAASDSLSFSMNGRWMVVDARGIGMIRVNLQTFEILPFADPFNYDIGLSPTVQSAVSSDGRFAVAYSNNFNRFTLYDLDTCAAVPNHITQKVTCGSRDLNTFVNQQVSSHGPIGTIRFVNDDLLTLYMLSGEYTLGLPGADASGLDYLALGDSFSSGEGAFSYKAFTDTKDNKCHLSLQSYPYLLGKQASLNQYESVACSGARMKDIVSNDENYIPQYKNLQPASFDTDIYNGFLVGYRPQANFISRYKPATMTVSVAGNDSGLLSHLRSCLKPGTCLNTYEDRVELVKEINNQFDGLVSIYTQLKSQAGPKTTVYAIGYPELFNPSGTCAVNVHLNQAEMTLGNQMVNYLNTVIQQAVNRAGIQFVDVRYAFAGHRLCETEPSDMAVNGLTTGNDKPLSNIGPIGSESYHPTALGQRLLAERVEQQIASLGNTNPVPNSNSPTPLVNPSSELLQAVGSPTGRATTHLLYEPMLTAQQLTAGTSVNFILPHATLNLKPNSTLQVTLLGANQTSLGPIQVDSTGGVSATITLPVALPSSFYELRAQGLNSSNESVTIYSDVFLASPNNTGKCPGVELSGVDADFDGIDDACDGLINAPIIPNSLYRVHLGDNAKNENPKLLYVERNVALSKPIFNIKDEDPDHDGWAIIAKSGGEGTSGQVANLWYTEDASKPSNDPAHYVMHLAVRPNNRSCIQLTPDSMGVVTKNQKRALKLEVENSSSCHDWSTDDSDKDGVKDSEQPLYRIRVSQGEHNEPRGKVFIERNVAAAEAQLLISDFSKYHDGWAIIAASKGPVKARVHGLVMLNSQTGSITARSGLVGTLGLSQIGTGADEPGILLEQANGRCRVLIPMTLDVVTNKRPHYLKRLKELSNISCDG